MKKLLLLALVASGIAVGAPSASACHLTDPTNPQCYRHSGCGFDTVAQETATGGQDTFTGVAYGYAVFPDQDTHTLRCYVTVDGAEVASTPTGSGTVFVTTEGTVTYTTSSTDVDLCTEVDGETISCGDAALTEIPPQVVIDLLDQVFATLDGIIVPIEEQLDPTICAVLKALTPGIPGVVDITADGDTTVAVVGPLWDCPPYGDLFPPA
jgi:hypothetical protein